MPRGTTLSTLRTMLKAAIGDNATGNTSRDSELNVLLSNEQKLYASGYDFPFLVHRWDLVCAAGSRFLALPTTTSSVADLNASHLINFDRPVKIEVKFNTIWLPVLNGITNTELSCHDSDEDERTDPIQRWRFASNTSEAANADKIEIWPLPATEQTIRFTGQRQLIALAADADKADLDDMLLVYSVAVKKATRSSLIEEAQTHLAAAKARELQTRSSYALNEGPLILGQPFTMTREDKRVVPMQVVA